MWEKLFDCATRLPPRTTRPWRSSGLGWRRSRSADVEHETQPAPRDDGYRGGHRLEFLPKPCDVDVHHIAAGVEGHIPDFLEQLAAGDDFAGAHQEMLEQRQLLRSDRQLGARHEYIARQPIENDVSHGQRLRALR